MRLGAPAEIAERMLTVLRITPTRFWTTGANAKAAAPQKHCV